MSTQDSYVAPSLITSGSTLANLQNGGFQGLLAKLLAANPAIANPTTAVTATATGGGSTGGSLPAGAYLASYTWLDGAGETTVGTSELASAVTISAGNIPRFTIPAIPTGACKANLYLTAASGASGTELLYATGISGTTFDASFAAGTNPVAPPAINNTGAVNLTKYLNSGTAGPELRQFWNRLITLVTNFFQGSPVGFYEARKDIDHLDYAFAFWKQATKEVAVLMAANHGTLIGTSTNVMPTFSRTFP